MSISSQIERITTAKTNLKNVANKYLPNTINNETISAYNVKMETVISKYRDNCPTSTVTNGTCANALDVPVKNYKIYGNSLQNGTPTPTNPIEITSVGDLVTSGEYTGKYKIPITVTGENEGEVLETNIYLDKPLSRIGTIKDYIEFATSKRHNLLKKIIFNGSETGWNVGSFGTNSYSIEINDMEITLTDNDPAYIISNLFRGVAYNDRTTSGNNIVYSDTNIVRSFYIRNTSFSSINEFKTFLANNNLIAYYKLKNPTEETITLPQINFFEGTNIVTIGTGVQATQEIVYITKGGN